MRKKIGIFGGFAIGVLGLTGAAGLLVALFALVALNLFVFATALAEGAALLVGAMHIYGHKFGKVAKAVAGVGLVLILLGSILQIATIQTSVFTLVWRIVQSVVVAYAIFKLAKRG